MASKTRRTAFGLAVGSLVVATGILLVGNSLSVVGIRGQGPQPLAAAETDFRPSAADEEEDDGDGTMVRLNFFNATWAAVLRKVAQDTGAELVMQKFPAGRYNRFDRTRYSRTDAVRILNRELEPKGFRILEQGNFLVLLQLDSLRTRYQRPLLPDDGELAEDEAAEDRPVRGVSSVKAPRRSAAGGEASTEFDEEQPLAARPADRRAEAANRGPQPRPRPAPAVEPASGTAEGASEATEVVVDARRSGAKEVARVIYSGLRDRSELVGNGPGNLPAFRVYRAAAAPTGNGEAAAARDARRAAANEPHFTIGIDADRDELVVSADAETQREIVQMIRTIDAAGAVRGRTVRLVSSDQELEGMAEKLQPVLDRMAAQNARRVAQLQPPPRGPLAPPAPEQPQPPPARPGAEQPRPEGEAPEAGPGAPPEGGLRIEGLHGPVRLRQTPGGLWIIEAADPRDADAVRRIIQELNLLVAGTLANVHLRPLQHVNSEAMAALLNDVYAELVTLRGGRVQASIIPVIKPNAILVLANATDLRTIDDLIVQLDAPVDPQTQFEVYSLRHAPATQVAATLQSLYPEAAPAPGTGLRPQVRVVADARTNTVIVQAAPRDLAEVALMIRRLDRDSSDAVSRMRIFPLKNAVALELAPVITEAIQSVLGAAAPGAPGAPGAPAAAGGAASRIIEFLTPDGDPRSLVRSGILSDVRVTADPRANSLIVSAPEQSMALMAELVRQLDQPTPAVAEIKVFTLANSDATAMAQLLTTLFAPAAAPGQAGAAGQPGIQVGGEEDSSSRLIPMRFSVDVRTNSLIAIGGAEALRVVEAVLLRLDETDVRERREVVIKLRNSPAADVAAAINAFLQQQIQLALADPQLITVELLERQIIVVPELVSNKLLISAAPKYYDRVLKIVEDLDRAPPEVQIQVLIVEVDLQNTDEFGIELGFQDSMIFDRGLLSNVQTLSRTSTAPNGVQTTTQEIISSESIPGFNFNNPSIPLGNNTARNPSSVGTQGLSNFSLGRINGDLGFGGLVLSAQSESISALIRALAAQRTVHILSRPQIRALDNQLASIQVGQQVPIIGSITTNPLTGIPQPQLGAPQQVGIILQVTPRITPEGRIVMETIATKSALSGQGVPIATDSAGGVIESPIIDVIQAISTVSVPDGQTIVLGGMITKTDNTLERKVPYLGDIPLLGRAFRYDSTTTRRTELLIFMTPRIIRSSADSELIKTVESERMHFLVEEAEEIHGPLFAVPVPDEIPPAFCPTPAFLPQDESYLPPLLHDAPDAPTTIMPAAPLPHTPAPGRSTLDDGAAPPLPAPPVFPGSEGAGAARRTDLSGRLSSRSR